MGLKFRELPVAPGGFYYCRDWYGVWWVRHVDNPRPFPLHQRVAEQMARVLELRSMEQSLDRFARLFDDEVDA